VTALSTGDLALDAGRVHVRGKGDKERIVPLGRIALEALEEYLQKAGRTLRASAQEARPAPRAKIIATGPGRLFLSLRGMPLTRQWVWQVVKMSNNSAARTGCAIVAPPTWWSMEPICAACS